MSEKEFEDFVKNHPYREYNTSDKEKLLPIYKDLLNKAIKYYPLTIDGRPLDLGDFNKDGNAYINGNQFIGSNVFDFPVSIDESTKKAYWDFNSLEATSEFIPFKLDAQADKDLIQYRDLYNQGKLNDLYSLILKNSQAKGYSFSEDSTLRESITTVESHYKKLGILPSATVTTFADSYKSGDKEKEARAVIKVYGLEARSYIPNGPKEIVQFLPYYYYGGLDYTRPENGKAAEEASIEAVFMEILEALELDSSRQTQVVTEIKTR